MHASQQGFILTAREPTYRKIPFCKDYTRNLGKHKIANPAGSELRVGDALRILPTLARASVDFVATDPPYNIQLPLTMAGGST